MSEGAKNKTILISGGGTGGHISPAIAIAQEFLSLYPSGTVVYIGKSGGREEQVVAKVGLPIKFYGISAQGFPRRISPKLFSAVYRTMVGFFQAMKVINQTKPKVVIGTGGYVSVTSVLSAQFKGIPTMIHEQNAIPGMANRLLGKAAKLIAVSYEDMDKYFASSKIRLTGNPVRSGFFQLNKQKGLQEYGFRADIPTILVIGGSQGALAINKNFISALEILQKDNFPLQVIIQTGDKGYKETVDMVKNLFLMKIVVQPFLFNIEMAFAAADLVVSRAGAISLSEIMVCGLPSILIPYPYATANHQEMNARVLEKNGAAVVILEKELSPTKLAAEIHRIMGKAEIRNNMAAHSKAISKPNAGKELCSLIESLMN